MEWTAVVALITAMLVAAVVAWRNENGKFKSAAEANIKLNQKVNRQKDVLKRKNREIKEMFEMAVNNADPDQLVDILNGLLKDGSSKGTDPVSDRSGSGV